MILITNLKFVNKNNNKITAKKCLLMSEKRVVKPRGYLFGLIVSRHILSFSAKKGCIDKCKYDKVVYSM